jgi:catechol 2,3-dioxygenase-like lactoylglutathione lyase family enzyme
MTIGVHHVAVSVPDIETARRFYIDLLGAQEVEANEWSAGSTLIDEIVGLTDSAARQFMVRLGNAHIEVFEYLAPRSPPQESRRPVNLYGYTHVALQVPDIDEVYRRMLAAGISFHTPPRHFGEVEVKDGRKQGFKATYGRDFFGNVFELLEINENSATKPL